MILFQLDHKTYFRKMYDESYSVYVIKSLFEDNLKYE